MGQCGCGDTTPEFTLPGPDGSVYALQIYNSCHYCYTPVSVIIYRFSQDEAEEWTDGAEPLEMQSYGHEDEVNAQGFIDILDPEKISKVLQESDLLDEHYNVDEMTARFVVEEAIWETRNDRALNL